jgi:hypothetical protein
MIAPLSASKLFAFIERLVAKGFFELLPFVPIFDYVIKADS